MVDYEISFPPFTHTDTDDCVILLYMVPLTIVSNGGKHIVDTLCTLQYSCVFDCFSVHIGLLKYQLWFIHDVIYSLRFYMFIWMQ